MTFTNRGFRLSQHGVVISDSRTSPGPTGSVVDVLAALIAALAPEGRVGLLGFAGGGMMAPLRKLGVASVIDLVDLDRAGYDLFLKHCPNMADGVNWQQGDAVAWLRQQPREFDLLMDDLSVSQDGDVFKPAISWKVLPELMRERLRPGGFGVFNLVRDVGGTWSSDLAQIVRLFGPARIISFDEFENRILVTGDPLPSARKLGFRVRALLGRLQSRQAKRIHVRTTAVTAASDSQKDPRSSNEHVSAGLGIRGASAGPTGN